MRPAGHQKRVRRATPSLWGPAGAEVSWGATHAWMDSTAGTTTISKSSRRGEKERNKGGAEGLGFEWAPQCGRAATMAAAKGTPPGPVQRTAQGSTAVVSTEHRPSVSDSLCRMLSGVGCWWGEGWRRGWAHAASRAAAAGSGAASDMATSGCDCCCSAAASAAASSFTPAGCSAAAATNGDWNRAGAWACCGGKKPQGISKGAAGAAAGWPPANICGAFLSASAAAAAAAAGSMPNTAAGLKARAGMKGTADCTSKVRRGRGGQTS